LKDCRVQTKEKFTQKQSYKTHPLLPETEATLVFVYFWFYTLAQTFTKPVLELPGVGDFPPLPTAVVDLHVIHSIEVLALWAS